MHLLANDLMIKYQAGEIAVAKEGLGELRTAVEKITIRLNKSGNKVTLKLKKKVFDLKRSILFLVDCSGSMSSNDRIGRAREAIISAVKGLGPDTEVAILRFAGCGSRVRASKAFTVCDDKGKAGLIAATKTLGSAGGTPLAAAIRYARWYLNRNARSKNVNMITLSDGEESCGGNPTTQARAMSK